MSGRQDATFTVSFLIPSYVQAVARILLKEGFQCYLVGGALRDVVMDILPDDYDLGTNALPEQMLGIFPKAVSTGKRFGTITVIMSDNDGQKHEVQVTTLRSEQHYVDGRWPSHVTFVDDIDEDLSRRDFTFNAMALDFGSAELDGEEIVKEWTIYDPFNGRADLTGKMVRAVGEPIERFREDGLRAYKACRMAAQLDFSIDQKTFDAVKQSLPIARQISMERVRDEFMKMLKNSVKPSVGIDLMREAGLLAVFMPELIEGVGVEQPEYHVDDVYTHALRTADVAPVDIRLAALFHDIGKPRKKMPNGHFYGHDLEGERITRQIMKRMKFSNADIDRVARLVRYHMFYFPVPEEDATEAEVEEYEAKKWSDAAVRRFISRVGEENVDDLFALRIADASSNPKSVFQPDEIELLQDRISEVRAQDMATKITDLAIDGHDLERIGIPPGPRMGEILKKLLAEVIEDPSCNERQKLEEMVRDMEGRRDPDANEGAKCTGTS